MLEWMIIAYSLDSGQPFQELLQKYPTEEACEQDRGKMAAVSTTMRTECVAHDKGE